MGIARGSQTERLLHKAALESINPRRRLRHIRWRICRKNSVFILKRDRLVVLFLFVDVSDQLIELRRRDRKGTIASLPMKRVKGRALVFDPLRGLLLCDFDQFADRECPRQLARTVNVILHAADAICLRVVGATESGEIGVHAWSDGRVEERGAILGAENQVQNDSAERLRHGERIL